jgi:hypothetical protein
MLPCPWCGEAVEPFIQEGSTFRWRSVAGCCTNGPEVRHDTLAADQNAANVDSVRRAIAAWNTRASTQPDVIDAEIARLREDALLDAKVIDSLSNAVQEAQAKIDELMLEYCPDDMTEEQIEEWKKHQRAVDHE